MNKAQYIRTFTVCNLCFCIEMPTIYKIAEAHKHTLKIIASHEYLKLTFQTSA